jgi:hypothetical protein
MASKHVTVGGHRYKLSGALTEAFRYQMDATDWAETEAENGDPDAQRVLDRRDEFLKAMPPRMRWLLIHTCLQLAAHAALAEEKKNHK